MRKSVLVLDSHGTSTYNWALAVPMESGRIVSKYGQLRTEFLERVTEEEVGLVVFDHSASLVEYLDFLTLATPDFRGDAIFISENEAFLSAITQGDGRILYRLNPKDLDFYFLVKLREMRRRPAVVFEFQPQYAGAVGF